MKHPVLAFIVIWNLLFLGFNLWTGAGLGWVAFSTFGAVAAASAWTFEGSRDRRPS
jgi:hypothetical protein